MGGGGADVFALGGNTLTGSVNGEAGGATLSGITNPTLTALGASAGFNGTATGVTGGFSNITNLQGTGTLTALAGAATWNGATYTSGNALTFGSTFDIQAGAGTDTFSNVSAASINDGGGATTLNGTISTGGAQTYNGAVTLGSATTLSAGGSIAFASTVTGTTFNFSATAGTFITPGTIDTGTGTITLIAGTIINPGSVRTTAITPAPGNAVGTFSSGNNVTGLVMDIQDAAGAGAPRQVLLTGTASTWTLTGPTGAPPDFAPTAPTVNITYNGGSLQGIGLAAQNLTGSVIGSTLADIARTALLETQETDSVQKQIAYGFVGDVGTTPPMDHRIDETGISVPKCFNDSREGQACQ